MASLGNALVSKILGHSDAEKAFRPWWDNLEDFLVYGLVMLGLIVAPTAIINSTPLDCTYCKGEFCSGKFETEQEPLPDPGFNIYWVKKYCTMTAVDQFVLYFPYILLIMALVIVLIERVFIRIFKAGLKLDMFYNLLVKEAVGSSSNDANKALDSAASDLENTKTAVEVSHAFSQGSNYFLSYVLRTLSELVVAAALFAWLLWRGLPSIQKEEFIYCTVHEKYRYECAGHPQQFYMYVLFVAIAILLAFLMCVCYNLMWLLVPQLGSLSRVMRLYKNQLRRNCTKTSVSDKDMLGELYNIYYGNRDLKLLLDLLAQSSGIAPSIRILSLFDKDFRAKSEPANLRVSRREQSASRCTAVVEFDDPRSVKEILRHIDHLAIMYTVEILPATTTSSVMAFKFGREDYHEDTHTRVSIIEAGDTEMQPLGPSRSPKRAEFRDLDASTEYSIRVCTVINGRAIARSVEVIKPQTEVVPSNAQPD